MLSCLNLITVSTEYILPSQGLQTGIQCALSGLLVDWLGRVKEEIMNESNKDQQY